MNVKNMLHRCLQSLSQLLNCGTLCNASKMLQIKKTNYLGTNSSMCLVKFNGKNVNADGTALVETFIDETELVAEILNFNSEISSNISNDNEIEDYSWEFMGRLKAPPSNYIYFEHLGFYWKAHTRNEDNNYELHNGTACCAT